MEKYRLRYAPSPTGFLHIGNTRTALMDYLFAKHYKGDFIVRIEDTDLERNVQGAIESQFANLKWLGIVADESYLQPGDAKYGPYIQSKKFSRYQDLAHQLVNQKFAYYCFCTEAELEQDYQNQVGQGIIATKYNQKCLHLTKEAVRANLDNHKPYTIRFQVPNRSWTINDLVRGEVTFHGKDLGDFVILKTNGIATYNFAVVVDDYDMAITHVVRGEEHISNTPRQMMIYEAFGWKLPQFCHLTLIVDSIGKKLSKRSGNALFFIEEYRKQGYLPQAMFNYIALLGWSPKGERELLSKAELIAMFDEKRFTKAPSTFDMVKMKWINSQYIKQLSDEDYLAFVKQFIANKYNWQTLNPEWINAVLLLYKKELEFGGQINNHLDLFLGDLKIDSNVEAELKALPNAQEVVSQFFQKLQKLDLWTVENLKQLITDTGLATQTKGKSLFMPIRIFATKSQHGPALAEVIYLLGQNQVLKNIQNLETSFFKKG